jgi:hypothetical protein
VPLWVELERYGKCRCLPEVLATYRVLAESACRRSDPLHAYRFSSSVYKFYGDALDLYPLPQGDAQTRLQRVRVARFRLRVGAVLGDRAVAKEQLPRLKELGAKLTVADRLLCFAAHLPLPRTLIVRVLNRTRGIRGRCGLAAELRAWHSKQ